MQQYIFETERIGLLHWEESDFDLAYSIWGNREIMKLLSSNGYYTDQQIRERLDAELENNRLYNVQYWKLYELSTSQFVGCCGLKPCKDEEKAYELGFQLLPQYWGKGYARECASFSISHALNDLGAKNIYAGHHPDNESSRNLLARLGFRQIDTVFYEPTGLQHPFYKYYETK